MVMTNVSTHAGTHVHPDTFTRARVIRLKSSGRYVLLRPCFPCPPASGRRPRLASVPKCCDSARQTDATRHRKWCKRRVPGANPQLLMLRGQKRWKNVAPHVFLMTSQDGRSDDLRPQRSRLKRLSAARVFSELRPNLPESPPPERGLNNAEHTRVFLFAPPSIITL